MPWLKTNNGFDHSNKECYMFLIRLLRPNARDATVFKKTNKQVNN